MEETFIVLMIKNEKTGFLEKELDSYKLENCEEYIVNMFAEEINNSYKIHMHITTGFDVEDWEYEAIYDHYDMDVFQPLNILVRDIENYNPTWELIFDYIDENSKMEKYIKEVIGIHKKEILEVLDLIKDKRNEYEL
ncbi:MAG: DUF6762 family protein [Lachnospirales bacterium]